jgi:hypothetical protein
MRGGLRLFVGDDTLRRYIVPHVMSVGLCSHMHVARNIALHGGVIRVSSALCGPP